jgi:hypothetical protein
MVNPNLPFDMTFVIKCQIGPHIITSSQAAVIDTFLSSVNYSNFKSFPQKPLNYFERKFEE